jgi:flagellar basal body P-ring formation protein FlgA
LTLAFLTSILLALPTGDGSLRQAFLDAVNARGYDASRLKVEVLRVSGVDIDAHPVRVELQGDAFPRSRTQVRVLRELPQGGHEAGWALLNVSHFDSVAVLNHSITSGSTFSPDDIRFEWTDITAFRGTPMRTRDVSEFSADAVWSRSIAEGRVLRSDDVRAPFAAQTGDTVLMDYIRSGLVLRLSCRAREAGSTGDIIRLYSPETRATYRARLTGPGTATWIETR